MAALDRKQEPELINVHRVNGDKDAILFLKNAEHEFVEGLFYYAKRYGHSEFYFRDTQYEIIRNKDSSFTISLSPEQDLNIEAFA